MPKVEFPTLDDQRCQNGVIDKNEECDVVNVHDYTCPPDAAYCWRCNHRCERELRLRHQNIPRGFGANVPPGIKRIEVLRDGLSSTLTIESDSQARIQKVVERFQNNKSTNEWRLAYDSKGRLGKSTAFKNSQKISRTHNTYNKDNKPLTHFVDADADGVFESQTHFSYESSFIKKVFDQNQTLKSEHRTRRDDLGRIVYRYSDRQGSGAPDFEAFYSFSKGRLKTVSWDLGGDGDFERVKTIEGQKVAVELGSSVQGFHTKEVTIYVNDDKPLLSYDIDLISKNVQNFCRFEYTAKGQLRRSYCLDEEGKQYRILRRAYENRHLIFESLDQGGHGALVYEWKSEKSKDRSREFKKMGNQIVFEKTKTYDDKGRISRVDIRRPLDEYKPGEARELKMNFYYDDALWAYAKKNAPEAIKLERTF